MIRIENIELEMEVLSQLGTGKVKHLRLSEGNRCYALVELDKGGCFDTPIDLLVKLSDKNLNKDGH